MAGQEGARLHRFDREASTLAERVIGFAEAELRHERDVLFTAPHAETLEQRLAGAITADGLGVERAFALFEDAIAPTCQTVAHPRFLAFVPHAPAVSGVLFDMAVSASGIFGTSWLEAAGATSAENQALRWLSDRAGLPASAGGTFVSGGTVANVNGLAVSRHAWRANHGDTGRRVAVAVSDEVHSSVRTSARVLEIDIVEVPTDERGRMTGPALAAALDATNAEVCAVAATGGITNLGVVDDLAAVAEVAKARGLWLHVDAAYGGAAIVSERTRALFDGIELADSLVIDPHKWLFTPLDCSALIYRDPMLARAAFVQTAAYLDALTSSAEVNPGDLAIHLTRRSRGLPFWFLLAAHGERALVEAVEASLDLARDTARLIERTPGLELALEPELSVVVFRRLGWSDGDYRRWSDAVLDQGVGLVLPTVWRGETLMRFCFVNPLTAIEDVQMLIDSLMAFHGSEPA